MKKKKILMKSSQVFQNKFSVDVGSGTFAAEKWVAALLKQLLNGLVWIKTNAHRIGHFMEVRMFPFFCFFLEMKNSLVYHDFVEFYALIKPRYFLCFSRSYQFHRSSYIICLPCSGCVPKVINLNTSSRCIHQRQMYAIFTRFEQ